MVHETEQLFGLLFRQVAKHVGIVLTQVQRKDSLSAENRDWAKGPVQFIMTAQEQQLDTLLEAREDKLLGYGKFKELSAG